MKRELAAHSHRPCRVRAAVGRCRASKQERDEGAGAVGRGGRRAAASLADYGRPEASHALSAVYHWTMGQQGQRGLLRSACCVLALLSTVECDV
jgi:hypothetical protein